MTEEICILGLLIRDRIKEAGRTQKVLTKYARVIKSRLGFHEVTSDVCSRTGIIILQISGPPDICKVLQQELSDIGGLEIQKMVFSL